MEKKIILISIGLVLMISPVFSDITCNPCEVGNCQCTITDCSSGILNVYTAECSGVPEYSNLEFSSGSVTWEPSQEIIYYLRVFCSDGMTKSGCIQVNVGQNIVTTTISPVTTTAMTSTVQSTSSVVPQPTTTTGGGTTTTTGGGHPGRVRISEIFSRLFKPLTRMMRIQNMFSNIFRNLFGNLFGRR